MRSMNLMDESINPYATPRITIDPRGKESDCERGSAVGAVAEIRSCVNYFRWIGRCGVALYGTFILIATYRGADSIHLLLFVFHLFPFVGCLGIARRLERKTPNALKQSRLLAIVLSTLYFPWLTPFGIRCFQRVTRSYEDFVAAEPGQNREWGRESSK